MSVVLQQQRFLLRGGDDAPDGAGARQEMRDGRRPRPGDGVVPEPRPQVLGLADVQHLPPPVAPIDVDAGRPRKIFQSDRREVSSTGCKLHLLQREEAVADLRRPFKIEFLRRRSMSLRSFLRSRIISSRDGISSSSAAGTGT